MVWKKSVIAFLLLVSCGSQAKAYTPSLLVFDYSQNNNTYTWQNSYHKLFDFDRLKCDLNLNTNSILLKKPYRRWQENLGAEFRADYTIMNGIRLEPFMSHTRSALENRIVYTSELRLAMPVDRISHIEVTPFVADRAIKRIGESPAGVDEGLGYGVEVQSQPLRILKNDVRSVVSYAYYGLNRIPFSEFSSGLQSVMPFGSADTLTWRVYNNENTTRYFIGGSQSAFPFGQDQIARQVKVDRGAAYTARCDLPAQIKASLDGDINFLSYYYRPGAQLLSAAQSDNYTQGRNYKIEVSREISPGLKLMGGYRYRWGKEDYRGNILDQWYELGELSFRAEALVFEADSVAFDGIAGVTSYYGLHGNSISDRDLETQIYNFRYLHVFNPEFSGELKIGYSNFHQIYTRSINSASNNQNETYLLGTVFSWRLAPRLVSNQEFGIQANYIIYDYVPKPIDTPSRIFRRGYSRTAVEWQITDRFMIAPAYVYRYEDYGKLIWSEDNWQQATGWDRRYHSLDLKLGYKPFKDIYIEQEYSRELKKEYNHVIADVSMPVEGNEIVREERLHDYKNIAGVVLTWYFSQTEFLQLNYSRREWAVRGRDTDITEFINVSVRYKF